MNQLYENRRIGVSKKKKLNLFKRILWVLIIKVYIIMIQLIKTFSAYIIG